MTDGFVVAQRPGGAVATQCMEAATPSQWSREAQIMRRHHSIDNGDAGGERRRLTLDDDEADAAAGLRAAELSPVAPSVMSLASPDPAELSPLPGSAESSPEDRPSDPLDRRIPAELESSLRSAPSPRQERRGGDELRRGAVVDARAVEARLAAALESQSMAAVEALRQDLLALIAAPARPEDELAGQLEQLSAHVRRLAVAQQQQARQPKQAACCALQ